ncbi:MAG: hypothetical protein ACK5KU_11145 [Beutenbergiaceae bacterium]
MVHKSAAFAGVLALVLTLAACGATDDSTAAADGGESENDSGPASFDPALLECGDVEYDQPQHTLPEVDLEQTTWAVPAGFEENLSYEEDRAVEYVESFWAATPVADPVLRNVLVVAVYSGIDWGSAMDVCGRVPRTVIDERLASYNEQNSATALTQVTGLEIGGLPALQQDLSFPLDQELNLPAYSYRGYWIFSRDQMVHLYCQWTNETEQERILAACEELLASVQLPPS